MQTSAEMKVYAAMSRVMADLAEHGIQKASVNTYDRYNFRGIDDVYNALSPILARHKLLAKPSMLTHQKTEVPTQKGGTQSHVLVSIELKFISAEDGSSESSIFYGEAMDRSDKATPKALTAAYKYGMFSTFCIPTEASVDADAESPTAAQAPESAPKLTEQQVATLSGLLEKCPQGTDEKFLAALSVKTLADVPPNRYDWATKALRERAA